MGDDAGTLQAALKGTLKAALRLGHNYIGTEHLLLGVLFADGAAGEALTSLGLGVDVVEAALAAGLAGIQRGRQAGQ
ncbi:MAG TPA: Clp protease N-terminal domain-containing protein [Streptosporangiaceae bacterium]|nr:Clp protease N-terminal domain-containing protein [Streptosporangiaceae bacterium]